MKIKGFNLIRLLLSLLLAGGILGLFVYVCIKGDLKNNILSWSCVIGCCVLSLVLVSFKSSTYLISLGLAATAAADYFLLYNIANLTENFLIIALGVLCGAQFFYFVYSLVLNGSIAAKVINIALRVALCLVVYFVMPEYYTIGTVELIALMCFANLFVSFLEFLFHFKTSWLLALGMFVLLASNFITGMVYEGFLLFNLSGKIVEFFFTYNIAFYTYVPALLLIAMSSVLGLIRKKE